MVKRKYYTWKLYHVKRHDQENRLVYESDEPFMLREVNVERGTIYDIRCGRPLTCRWMKRMVKEWGDAALYACFESDAEDGHGERLLSVAVDMMHGGEKFCTCMDEHGVLQLEYYNISDDIDDDLVDCIEWVHNRWRERLQFVPEKEIKR